MKFYFLLGEKLSETVTLLKAVYKYDTLGKTAFVSGLRALKTMIYRLTLTSPVNRPRETPKMLHELEFSSTMTDGGQLNNSKKIPGQRRFWFDEF